jgi:hypothetical protein
MADRRSQERAAPLLPSAICRLPSVVQKEARGGLAPAIANAVYHATGKRVRDLPVTIDKLL